MARAAMTARTSGLTRARSKTRTWRKKSWRKGRRRRSSGDGDDDPDPNDGPPGHAYRHKKK
jgi:hypothetical protein